MSDIGVIGDLIAAARKAGADAADALLISSTGLSVERRLGRTENLERAETQHLGLRVFVGRRAAIVSSSSVDPTRFNALAEQAVAMAKVVPEDPFGGLAEEAAPPTGIEALDVTDPSEPDSTALLARAAAAEEAALAIVGITNSEGASAGYSRTIVTMVTSAGFAGTFSRTGHSISAAMVAGEGTGMQRDYDYASTVHLADLPDAAAIGRRAAEQALARLSPGRPATAKLPVLYHPRVAGGLVGHLAGAANGAGVARGTSFLKENLGQQIFRKGITIRDDPRRVRGLRSRPFDGEGVPTEACALVEDGVLTNWLLDSRSARQLGLRTGGHAVRGTSSPPGPSSSNLYMEAGTMTPAELMADIKEGLFVTELIGMGVNGVTGDYSRGAAGFMIRDGALAEPVAEITIAGNLHTMFSDLTPANDLEFRRGTDAPTIRIDGMTMAGA